MSSYDNKMRNRSRSRSRDKKKHYRNGSDDRDRSHYSKSNKSSRRSFDEGVKMYLTNLGSNVTERRVVEEFKKYGEVADYSIKRMNGKSNYFGYVIMRNKDDAEEAMFHINRHFGWKVTLYDRDDKRDRHSYFESPSRSESRSRSRRVSFDHNKEDERNKSPTTNDIPNKVDAELKTVKVREIWVGNLPTNITESTLYHTFFIYGEISRIDIVHDKNFAFIRYKQCASASRAYEKAKNMNLNGNVLRISFSDSGKRREIIGDEPGYELNEKTCKLLHCSLNKNCQIAPESTLREIFKQYGTIKGLNTKSSPGFRPSVYVEYSKSEEAENAIKKLTNLDPNGEKRRLIGDPACDINYYYKKKTFPNENLNMISNNNMINAQNMNPRMMYPYGMNPMMMQNPQMMQHYYQMWQRQQQMINANQGGQQQQGQIPSNFQSQAQNQLPSDQGNYNKTIPYSYQPRPSQSQSQQPQNQLPPNAGNLKNQSNPNMIPPYAMRYPYTYNPMMRNPMMYGINPNQQNFANQEPQQQSQSNVKDLMQDLIGKLSSERKSTVPADNDDNDLSSIKEDENDFERNYSLEDENLKNIWGGFLTKNKKDRVCVDAYQIRHECSDLLNSEHNLNVSHRTHPEEVMKRPIIGIIAFSPQNATQCEIFQEYINYFQEKQRVGVINLKNQEILYLIPPSDFSRKFYQNPKKHLLGIVVNSTVEPKSYVDMNNLVLPPPVISLTEKRRLLKEQKKSSGNTPSATTTQDNTDASQILSELSKLLGNEKLGNILNSAESDSNQSKQFADINNLLINNPQLKNLLSQLNK